MACGIHSYSNVGYNIRVHVGTDTAFAAWTVHIIVSNLIPQCVIQKGERGDIPQTCTPQIFDFYTISG